MTLSPTTLAAVALGGAVGSASRYIVSGLTSELMGAGFPFGTLVVNVLGCFLMGVLTETGALVWQPAPELRVLMTTGFLGGFTTFSTFALDVGFLAERGDMGPATTYVLASVLMSIAALFAGFRLVRSLVGVP